MHLYFLHHLCTLLVLIIIIIICQLQPSESRRSSKITFQNGVYNNILVGLDEIIDVAQCAEIITEMKKVFESTSTYLQQATNGATFGSIVVIIPWRWENRLSDCGLTPADIANSHYDTFEEADFKITSGHPFARTVPWTNQYRGCGESAESLYIPANFLQTNAPFDAATKGRLILHEWMKFRYGVFDEHGYYDDLIYSPCYTRNQTLLYSSCTNNNGGITPISTNVGNEEISPEECRQLVEQNEVNLQSELSRTNPSVMYNPHLTNGHHICTNVTHNGMNPTKQNILCERKSVSDVIRSHADFGSKSTAGADTNENDLDTVPDQVSREVRFQFVIQEKILRPAYFIVIEDSLESRRFNRVKHVKQALAEFLRLAPDGSLVQIMEYSSRATLTKNELDDDKRLTIMNILKSIPEGSTQPDADNANTDSDRALRDVFVSAINSMNTEEMRKWELVLIVSSPPTAVDDALQVLRNTDYPVSILTFNDSKDWLRFYSIHNIHKVVHLPYCYSQSDGACHGRTSTLITDHLMELVNGLKLRIEPQRFFHKVVDSEITGLSENNFTIPNLVEGWRNFYLFVPIYDEYTYVSVSREGSPQVCNMTRLLEYEGLLTLDCSELSYLTGNWIVSVSGSDIARRRTHVIRGYVETSESPRDLKIFTSYGFKPENEIFPRMNHRFPIYTAVTNINDQPIVHADVQLRIVYQLNDVIYTSNLIELFDDGEDPDITKNDGVYSAFITTFYSDPSFHSGYVSITTSANSKSVHGYVNEAALLSPTANSKCCGSSVLFSDTQTQPIDFASYTRVIPSFRTGESFDPGEDILPPSRINSRIKIIAVDEEYVTVEFIAPGADHKEGIVNRYNICCTDSESVNLDDAMCTDISPSRCNPVQYNETQECGISMVAMYDAFYSGEKPENETCVRLYCGLRGIDSANNAGPMSAFVFEIILEFDVLEDIKANTNECRSIGDGCLPVWVFWVMIGCLVLLLAILIVVVIFWIITTRRKKNSPQSSSIDKREIERKETISRPVTTTTTTTAVVPAAEIADSNSTAKLPPSVNSGPIPLHNVYINEAYIQDTSGQLRLVASDGQFFDSNHSTMTRHGHHHQHHSRRPVSIEPYEPMTERNTMQRFENRRHHVPQQQNHRMSPPPVEQSSDKDMPIFFTNSSGASPEHSNPTLASPNPRQEQQQHQQHENIYARANSGILPPRYTHNLRDRVPSNEEPIPKSRQPRAKTMYVNPRIPETQTHAPAASPPEQNGSMSPIYASVSRTTTGPQQPNGIRRPQSLQIGPSPSKVNPYHVSDAPSNGREQIPPSSHRPQSEMQPRRQEPTGHNHADAPLRSIKSTDRLSMNPSPTHQPQPPPAHKIIPLPPVRLDHFPSSESETYSDMSHIIAIGKNPDRTPPATLPLPPPSQTLHKYSAQQQQRQRDNDNTKDNRNMSPIKEQHQQPPPPPIPKTPPNQNRFGPRRGVRGSANRPQFMPPPPPRRQSQLNDNSAMGGNDAVEEYYDDDSDEWGNYDDDVTFQPTGQSFA